MPAAAEKQAGEACVHTSTTRAVEPQESPAREGFEAEADLHADVNESVVALRDNAHGEVAFGWRSASEG